LDTKNLGRRDAQQLAKEGSIAKAIETFKESIAEGGAPYDFVYLGDLCIRDERPTEAIAHYEEAIAGYTRLGFHRNAIALWRKILRLDGARLDAYARMGDLHGAEQLVGDALHDYFVYLERARESERGSDAFHETLKRVEEIAPQRAEYAIRLSEFLVQSDQTDAAAAVLARAAEIAQTGGAAELASDMLERARRLDPQVAGPATPEEWSVPAEEPVLPPIPAEFADAGPLQYNEIDLAPRALDEGDAKEPVDREGFPTHHRAIEERLEAGLAEEALALCEGAALETGSSGLEAGHLSYLRGRALAHLGRHAEAMQAMRLALQEAGSDPETVRWTYTLALELETAGELDEARALLRETVGRDPGWAEAADRLARLEKKAA
jgi:tetratricopeptide (TPR) repeat protein